MKIVVYLGAFFATTSLTKAPVKNVEPKYLTATNGDVTVTSVGGYRITDDGAKQQVIAIGFTVLPTSDIWDLPSLMLNLTCTLGSEKGSPFLFQKIKDFDSDLISQCKNKGGRFCVVGDCAKENTDMYFSSGRSSFLKYCYPGSEGVYDTVQGLPEIPIVSGNYDTLLTL